ncbi:MAG: class I SAM-dependent methyltransferase [Minisyncoccia bacterium]
MGISKDFERLLRSAKQSGCVFERTLTISKLADKNGRDASWLWRELKAARVDSLDAGDYEGANIVHDLNNPLPVNFNGLYDAVIEGGTLEHVFNFPTAIKTAMELVKPGGRIFMVTPTNNYCGHGFYQFSPELFFRIFSPDNGFKVERMIIYRLGPLSRWYEVSDPNDIRCRTQLISYTFTDLMVQALKTETKEIFRQWPQQGLYAADWKGKSWQPEKLSPLGFHLHHSFLNRKLFKKIK